MLSHVTNFILLIMNEYSFTKMDCGSRFTDFHVRRSAYWSEFSGGRGITYGCYGYSADETA